MLCRLAARKKKLLLLPPHRLLKLLLLLLPPRLLHRLHRLLKPRPLHRPLTLLLPKLLPLHPMLPPPLPLLLPQLPKPPAPLLQPSNQHSDLKPASWPVFFRPAKSLEAAAVTEMRERLRTGAAARSMLSKPLGNQASIPVQPKPSAWQAIMMSGPPPMSTLSSA